MIVLVTRPEPDNRATSEKLRALGHEALLAPMLRFEAVPFESIAADAFSGASDWDSAPDNTDPRGFVIFAIEDRRPGRPARRGPNGHRRSDERLLAAIYQQILSTHHIDAGDVSIEVHKRRATLTGSVPERWMRHAIDSLVDRTPDVHYVHNRIRVRQLLEVPGMDWHEESPLSYSSAGS